MTSLDKGVSRRRLLGTAGLAVAAAGVGTGVRGEVLGVPRRWDHEADIVCIGGGAAGLTAAVTAAAEGASVVVLEKGAVPGGTTARSGGVFWIPNHYGLRQRGIVDARDDCLRYLVRYSYPELYDAESPSLGIDPVVYRQLGAFYDNGYVMVDRLRELGALGVTEFRMWHLNRMPPDYFSHAPENRVPAGRPLSPTTPDGSAGRGANLILHLQGWLTQRGVPLLTGHRVTGLVMEEGRVIGVAADRAEGEAPVMVRARQAVIFASGGFAHNPQLIRLHHKPFLYGACADPGATGDFVAIAGAAGARFGNMGSAWRTPVVFEEALENRVVSSGAFVPPGDSMFLVNRYGVRVVNEKRNYNDRTRIHNVFDPNNAEYPNQLMFMVYDQRTAEAFAGNYPLPLKDPAGAFVITGDTLDALADALEQRLTKLAGACGSFRLHEDFAKNLKATVARFNGFARSGKDEDFQRGAFDYDRAWMPLFAPMRTDTGWPANDLPNPTLHPLRDEGPYYAMIMAPGVLDTNGGPVINEHAQILSADGAPIPGLYGAGNCIASPSREAYFGAGATIGLAMTFGYVAARHARGQPTSES